MNFSKHALTLCTLLFAITICAKIPTIGIIIPGYFYPSSNSAEITSILTAKQQNPNVPIMVILNPNSGVGTSIDSNYVNAIKLLQQNNIIVVGYVATTYAARSAASVQNEVATWKSWYAPNGIFFDEVSSTNLTYYKNLNTYTKSLGLKVTVLNPGTLVPTTYANAADLIVIYENIKLPTLSKTVFCPTNKAGIIVTNQASLPTTFLNSLDNYASWIYVTNDSGSNPYDTLPSYFQQLVALFR